MISIASIQSTDPGAIRRPIARSLFVAALVAAVFASAPAVAAPNLVPNPSFTLVTLCPTALEVVFGQIHLAEPWERAGQSPDLFHYCGSPSVSVPNNAPGWQCPYGEDCMGSTLQGGYAGISVYSDSCSDCREYLQVELNQPLAGGVRYRVSFYVSLADDDADYAIDRIGAHLSDGAFVPVNGGVLPVQPQVESQGGPIVDTVNWVLITGKFRADGGEDNITLGNFREDPELDVEPVSGEAGYAYYFVDQVSVQKADITDLKNPGPEPDHTGMMTTLLYGATPGSRAVLYGAGSLATSEIEGHTFDLGPEAVPLAEATVGPSGTARFQWPWQASLGLADPNTGRLYLEASSYDLRDGLVDSDEVVLAIDLANTAGW